MADLTVTVVEEAAEEQATGGCCEPDCGPETCGSASEVMVELKVEEQQASCGCGPSTGS